MGRGEVKRPVNRIISDFANHYLLVPLKFSSFDVALARTEGVGESDSDPDSVSRPRPKPQGWKYRLGFAESPAEARRRAPFGVPSGSYNKKYQ